MYFVFDCCKQYNRDVGGGERWSKDVDVGEEERVGRYRWRERDAAEDDPDSEGDSGGGIGSGRSSLDGTGERGGW